MTKQKDHLTIADVAARADVSAMTVSRVLNNKEGISEETRQHVLSVMHELGYRPNRVARSLATARTLKIGIVVPSISSAYYGAVLEGVERIFWEHGYHIVLCNTANSHRREQAVLNLFEEDRVDGVIVFSSHLTADELTLALGKQRAAITINADVEPGVAGSIFTDELKSMETAVTHLMNYGRRCIGYVSWDVPTYASRERKRGFVEALKAADLPVASEWIVNSHRRTGYTTTRQLLESERAIDSLICFNAEIAAGALRACHDLGLRVPDDVAVIGYDDIFLAELLTPSLTTLRLQLTKREVGALAARMLLERIEGHPTQDQVLLNHELIVRESAPFCDDPGKEAG